MKKFLSLVLALVMTMSLVTMAGAKDFTDASEITYKEAVDVMSALKIVDGDTTGAFNPDGTLTRGAAAKIICNLILGPTTASALVADTAPFPDVPANHTFAGYIAYCAQKGIINGYTDGTFKPANGLTGYAFMKMLLGALGYDASVEKYVGPNSFINVAKQALAIGLDDGKENFNGVDLVTREEAMLYSFNALTSTMVDYSSKIEVNNGNSMVTISGGRYEVTNTKANDYRESGSARDEYMQFCEKYFKNLTLDTDEAADAFGRPASTWYVKNTKIGTYTKTADVSYTANVKSKDVYADIDADENYEFEVIVDGADTGKTFKAMKKETKKLGGAEGYVPGEAIGNGSLIEVFVEDGVVTVINTYIMEVAEDYDEDDEELTLEEIDDIAYPGTINTTLSSDDIAGLKGYEEGDKVVVTMAENDDGEYDIVTIAAADKVTGTITEFVHDESITTDETYKYNVINDATDVTYTLKSEADIYVDAYGYALYVEAVESAKEYVYIYEFSRHSTAAKGALNAYGYFTDGTEEEMTISKIGSTKVYGNDQDSYPTGWYTYTEKDGKYELKSVANKTYGTGYAADDVIFDYRESHTDIRLDKTKQGNSKTTFIVLETDGDVKVYTGVKNAAKISAASTSTKVEAVLTGEGSKYTEVVFVDGGKVSGGSNSSDVIFLVDWEAAGHDADNVEYYRYKAIVNGEVTSIRMTEEAQNLAELREGSLWYNVIRSSNDKRYVIDCEEVDGDTETERDGYTKQVTSGKDVDLDDDTLTIDGVDYYLADSCNITTIYDKTIKQNVSAKTLKNNDLKYAECTVYGVMNDDGEYTALYIWGTK